MGADNIFYSTFYLLLIWVLVARIIAFDRAHRKNFKDHSSRGDLREYTYLPRATTNRVYVFAHFQKKSQSESESRKDELPAVFAARDRFVQPGCGAGQPGLRRRQTAWPR